MNGKWLFYLGCLVIVFGGVLFSVGWLGANDFPYTFREQVVRGLAWPSVWTDRWANGLGERVVVNLWAWPIDVSFSILAQMGVNYGIITRVIGVWLPLLIGSIGMWQLLKSYHLKDWGRFVGISVYLLNSYFILLIDGGQIVIGLAYSWVPMSLWLVQRAIQHRELTKWGRMINQSFLTASLGIVAITFFDIRYVLLLGLIVAVLAITEVAYAKSRLKLVQWWLMLAATSGLFLIGLHTYWWWPLINTTGSVLPAGYTNISQVSFLQFATMGYGWLLQQPHWFLNSFGRITPLSASFLIFPLLAFSVLLIKRPTILIWQWLLVALVGLFLAKGISSPFGQSYGWLYEHLPGFVLFRDSTKFYLLIGLSYAILSGIAISALQQRNAKWGSFLAVGVMCYLVWLNQPVWRHQLTGLMSTPRQQLEYQALATTLQNDHKFGRVLWLPQTKGPLGYVSENHPSVEANRLTGLRPFMSGVKGSYETNNWLREASYAGQLLDVTGVQYVVYATPDRQREEVDTEDEAYYQLFLKQLMDRFWVSDVLEDSPIPILKTSSSQPLIYQPSQNWLVIGSDAIYGESTKSANLGLANNGLIFGEEMIGLADQVKDRLPVLLYQKSLIDLTASYLSEQDLIFPALQLSESPGSMGWWKRDGGDLIWWREFLQQKYGFDNQDFDFGGGWAIAEGRQKLTVPLRADLKLPTKLLARVMESSRSGALIFRQGDKVINQVTTASSTANVRWFEVGQVESLKPIEIESQGDINVVNALALVDEGQWQALTERANRQLIMMPLEWREINVKKPNIEFTRLGLTRYSIKVTQPGLIVLNQSYDSLWRLNNQPAMPVYSILNGWIVDRPGEYQLEYYTQKFVYQGLAISVLAVILIALAFFITHNKEDGN